MKNPSFLDCRAFRHCPSVTNLPTCFASIFFLFIRHIQWESRFQALLKFKETYGHTQVPINWEDDIQLANWVSTQRQEYQNMLRGKNSRLDKKRMERLNATGFSWALQRGGRRKHLHIQRNPDEWDGQSPPAHPANEKKVGAKKAPPAPAVLTAAVKLKYSNQQDEEREADKLASALGKRKAFAQGTDIVRHHQEQAQAATAGRAHSNSSGNHNSAGGNPAGAGTTSRQTAVLLETLLTTRPGLSPELLAQVFGTTSRRNPIEPQFSPVNLNDLHLGRLASLIQSRQGSNSWVAPMSTPAAPNDVRLLTSLLQFNADGTNRTNANRAVGDPQISPLFPPSALQLPLQGSSVASAAAAVNEPSRQRRAQLWNDGVETTTTMLMQQNPFVEPLATNRAATVSLLEQLESAKRARDMMERMQLGRLQQEALRDEGRANSAVLDRLLAARAPGTDAVNRASTLPLDAAMELSRLARQGPFHRP